MADYLKESQDLIINNFEPITPKESDWIVEEKRLIKTYTFKSSKFLEAFIVEIVKYNRDADALVELRVKGKKAGIIIHTRSFQLTEIEFEAQKDINKIKKDVMYYYADKE